MHSIYGSHIENGWIVCGCCGAKQFPIGKDTEIKNFVYLCRKGKGMNKHYIFISTDTEKQSVTNKKIDSFLSVFRKGNVKHDISVKNSSSIFNDFRFKCDIQFGNKF